MSARTDHLAAALALEVLARWLRREANDLERYAGDLLCGEQRGLGLAKSAEGIGYGGAADEALRRARRHRGSATERRRRRHV